MTHATSSMSPSQIEDTSALQTVVVETERLQSDPGGFTRLLTNDVVLVNAVGRRVFGRDAVRDAMVAALETPLANVLTRNEIVDIRFISQDVAVVSGKKHIRDEGDGTAAPGSEAVFSFVLVREDDAWRIAVAHNTLIRERYWQDDE